MSRNELGHLTMWTVSPARSSQPQRAAMRGSWLFLLALVSGLVMLPRLLSPHFGLLDDGITVYVARRIVGDWTFPFRLVQEAGRFIPAYWFFYGLSYVSFGLHPLPFFLVNWLLLFGSAACLVTFVTITGTRERAAMLSGLLFVVSGPVIENFYTLSKCEPIQTLWLTASLLCVAALAGAEAPRPKAAILVSLLFGFLLLANLTKETSLVLIPISCSWFLVDKFVTARRRQQSQTRGYAMYALASIVATGLAWGLRWYFSSSSVSQGSYTQAYRLEWTTIISSLSRWIVYGSRDFPYLVPLLAGTAIWFLGSSLSRNRYFPSSTNSEACSIPS